MILLVEQIIAVLVKKMAFGLKYYNVRYMHNYLT